MAFRARYVFGSFEKRLARLGISTLGRIWNGFDSDADLFICRFQCIIISNNGWPGKRAEVFMRKFPARFTRMNFRTVVTQWITCEFSSFGSRWKFLLALASTEWFSKTKDTKIILSCKSGCVFKATHTSRKLFIPANRAGPFIWEFFSPFAEISQMRMVNQVE